MTQSKLGSLYEAILNTLIGFVISFGFSLLIYPLFHVPISFGTNLQITGVFTVLSIVRGYVLRRWFNARLHALSLKLAGESA